MQDWQQLIREHFFGKVSGCYSQLQVNNLMIWGKVPAPHQDIYNQMIHEGACKYLSLYFITAKISVGNNFGALLLKRDVNNL